MDDQRWACDAIDHVGGDGSRVVIVGLGEAAIVGGHAVVKFSKGSDAAQPRRVEVARKQADFAPKPAEELRKKIIFVNTIRGLVQRVGPGGQIDRRAYGNRSPEFREALFSPFPRKFSN